MLCLFIYVFNVINISKYLIQFLSLFCINKSETNFLKESSSVLMLVEMISLCWRDCFPEDFYSQNIFDLSRPKGKKHKNKQYLRIHLQLCRV